MVEPAPITRLFPTLEARPPTPPRESEHNEPAGFFGRIFLKDRAPRNSIITPDSSAESPTLGSATGRKRVEWAASAEYKEPPILSSDGKSSLPQLQPLPASGDRKPIKSILKAYNGNVQTFSIGSARQSPTPEPTLNAQMLESTVQQLAGKDKISRVDAYTILAGALKVSDNVPDLRALKEKMGLLLQFIQRDMTAKTSSGTADMQLITPALVLLSSFLHKEAIAEMLTSDFSIYMVEHSIKTLEDPGMSKEIAKHLMFILAQQRFSSKIMNAERVGRLIAALHNIEEYIKGKSIVIQRINIYRTLLRRSQSHMLANTDWLQDLFPDMLSNFADIQNAAIAFGREASLTFGTEGKISRAVMEIFQGTRSEVKFADYYAKRLMTMVRKQKESANAPQIWAVVILFLRFRPQQIDGWQFTKLWLEVIQVCFNSSDQATKIAANLAWNRMVFAVSPDEKTPAPMVQTLRQPLLQQLTRREIRKLTSVNKTRRATLGSICNLLYYSLRPNSTIAQLDRYWDEYVIHLIGNVLVPTDVLQNPDLAGQDLKDACWILEGLIQTTRRRDPWNEARAMEDNGVETSELPPLDPKWIRRNASRVFSILSPIIESLYWDLSIPKSTVTHLWKTYITSIASAAIMEVKVSNDTMASVACIFSLLYKIWQKGPKGLQARPIQSEQEEDFLQSFQTLVTTTIDGLGLLPFTERLLSIGQQDSFVVIATPSHRPGRIQGEPRCPLHHLLALLITEIPGVEYNDEFSEMIKAILAPFFKDRVSSKGKMDLVKDLLQLLPTTTSEPPKIIWDISAEYATLAINTPNVTEAKRRENSDQPLGTEYRNVVKILEHGIELSPVEPTLMWKHLFEALTAAATIDVGDAGRAIIVIDPIARALTTKLPTDSLRAGYCLTLISPGT